VKAYFVELERGAYVVKELSAGPGVAVEGVAKVKEICRCSYPEPADFIKEQFEAREVRRVKKAKKFTPMTLTALLALGEDQDG
jgi:hypothetical protein